MLADGSNLLSLWQALPAAESGAVSFGLPDEAAPAASLWRLDLPEEAQSAEGQLAQIEARTQASEAALDALPARLEALIGAAQAGPAVSFAAGEPSLEPAEADLLRMLEELEGRQAAVSFEAGQAPPSGWQQARQSFEDATGRLFRTLTHQAWVKTTQGGRLLGRSALGWSGDLETIYQVETHSEQVSLHQRSLAAAVKTRHTILRTFIFTAQGAAKLAVLISAPGGLLLALPAVWKFANQVLAEVND